MKLKNMVKKIFMTWTKKLYMLLRFSYLMMYWIYEKVFLNIIREHSPYYTVSFLSRLLFTLSIILLENFLILWIIKTWANWVNWNLYNIIIDNEVFIVLGIVWCSLTTTAIINMSKYKKKALYLLEDQRIWFLITSITFYLFYNYIDEYIRKVAVKYQWAANNQWLK